jgi:predicted dehydrogenase
MPEPVLVGRNVLKLNDLAKSHGLDTSCVTTDLDAALADPRNTVYFDAQTTGRRSDAVKKAIAAGKHVYCEKPTAVSTAEAYDLYKVAKDAGVKQGVVQDKLWLPGLVRLKTLIDSGFFGEILSVKGDFGYWVFTGLTPVAPQRPSWNYRKEDDGGIIVDMLCHWRYVIHNLFGPIKSLSCLGATHIKERVDEDGKKYKCTADDAAYATFELENGVVVHFNSSWVTRGRRDKGFRGGRSARLRGPARQRDPPPDLEPGRPQQHRPPQRLDQGARLSGVRQRVQGAMGDVPPSCGQGRAVEVRPAGGGKGRAADGAGSGELGEAAMGGCARAGAMMR